MKNLTCGMKKYYLAFTSAATFVSGPRERYKTIWKLSSFLCALLILSGCASTKVTQRETLVQEQLPRPNQIVVYDFSASPADVPADSVLAGQAAAPAAAPTQEQDTLARQLGIEVASRLVEDIQKMGLPAVHGAPGTPLQPNDIVIRGYFASVEAGKAGKRMVVGFGSGGSELTTVVEGYQMTPQGLRKVGSGTLESKSGKGPGMGVGGATWLITGSPVGLIVGGGMKVYGEATGRNKIEGRAKATADEIADKLKIRFQQEGWIAG